MKTELHPHQQEAIAKMHNGCVLWGGVGTGKTITALAYAMQKESGKPIVVVTTAKVRDHGSWESEAAKLGINFQDIQVTSWNKINDLIEYKDHFVIFDEQRLVGTGAWVRAFYKIAAKNRWILLTATPGDTWSDYAPMFIANGWYKNITDFRRQHAVYSRFTKYPKIERWVNEGKLQKYRSQLLVKMPMLRHTTRHIHHVECDYDKEKLDFVLKKRWNIYEDEPIKNAAELYMVMRKIVSTDPSRIWEIRKLLKKHPKLIIFYNYNYELDILRDLCRDLEKTKDKDYSWVLKEPKTLLTIPTETKSTIGTASTCPLMLPADSAGEPLRSETTKKLGEKLHDKTPMSSERSLESSRLKQTSQPLKVSLTKGIPNNTWDPTKKSSLKSILPKESSSLNQTTVDSLEISTKTRTDELEFSWAEWNGHKHEQLPTTSSWIYLVQYMSGSEGWNCTETDSMAFWSLTYSWKQFHQAQGRIDRLNTPFTDLHYYVLMTDSLAERPVLRALEAKHDFQPR